MVCSAELLRLNMVVTVVDDLDRYSSHTLREQDCTTDLRYGI